jgi:hypothetical protein
MRVKNAAVVACAVVAGGLLSAARASADPAGAMVSCDPGLVCVYERVNFGAPWGGASRVFGLSDLNWADDVFDDGTPVNDRVSSVWNRTNQYINFYVHAGAHIGDLCLRVEPNGSRANLAEQGCDNVVSSHYAAGV